MFRCHGVVHIVQPRPGATRVDDGKFSEYPDAQSGTLCIVPEESGWGERERIIALERIASWPPAESPLEIVGQADGGSR